MYYYRDPLKENDRKAPLYVFAASRQFTTISNSSFPFSKERQLSPRTIAQGNACLVAKFYI